MRLPLSRNQRGRKLRKEGERVRDRGSCGGRKLGGAEWEEWTKRGEGMFERKWEGICRTEKGVDVGRGGIRREGCREKVK